MNNFYSLRQDEYYIRRKAISTDFEESYWGEVKDPDGETRCRINEREIFLEDTQYEIQYINNLPPGKVIDIGCGLGFFLSGINSKWDKYGLEISNFASKHASQWGTIHTSDFELFDFKKDYYDAIVLHHVIEHLKNPELLIKKIYNTLKVGGVLVIGTPDLASGFAGFFGTN